MTSSPPADWYSLLDMVLRGVSHSLSNRTAALSALFELPRDDDPEIHILVPAELGRLHELNRLVRLLPAEPNAGPEALVMADVVADALALLELHPQHRDLRFTYQPSDVAVPVRAPRWMLLRLVLLLCDAVAAEVAANVAASVGEVVVETTAGDGTLCTRVSGATARTPYIPPTAASLAPACGASIAAAPGTLELTLLSLEELRRRERGGAAPPR